MRENRRQRLTVTCIGAFAIVAGTHCAAPAPPPPVVLPPPPPVLPEPPCPAEMVEVEGAQRDFCIDKYEASLVHRGPGGKMIAWPSNHPVDGSESEIVAVSRAGTKPQGYISGQQAARACENAGKRLCQPTEWVTACRGPKDTRYPYGNQRQAGVCNDRFARLTGHPVQRLFRDTQPRGTKAAKMWSPEFMNDPRLHELPDTVTPSGTFAECTNEYGAVDMVGNLHEWVADPNGTFLGGFFMDTFQNGEGCEYRTRAHGFSYHDYSTGFRCCADVSEGPERPARL
jgi:sulfatase modifying factor 1